MSAETRIDDGGPAFPTPVEFDPNGQLISYGGYGMSLRDWFAGQALAGMMALPAVEGRGCWHTNSSPNQVAQVAYEYADAMIAVRKGCDVAAPDYYISKKL